MSFSAADSASVHASVAVCITGKLGDAAALSVDHLIEHVLTTRTPTIRLETFYAGSDASVPEILRSAGVRMTQTFTTATMSAPELTTRSNMAEALTEVSRGADGQRSIVHMDGRDFAAEEHAEASRQATFRRADATLVTARLMATFRLRLLSFSAQRFQAMVCCHQVRRRERLAGRRFDAVLRMRPDLILAQPLEWASIIRAVRAKPHRLLGVSYDYASVGSSQQMMRTFGGDGALSVYNYTALGERAEWLRRQSDALCSIWKDVNGGGGSSACDQAVFGCLIRTRPSCAGPSRGDDGHHGSAGGRNASALRPGCYAVICAGKPSKFAVYLGNRYPFPVPYSNKSAQTAESAGQHAQVHIFDAADDSLWSKPITMLRELHTVSSRGPAVVRNAARALGWTFGQDACGSFAASEASMPFVARWQRCGPPQRQQQQAISPSPVRVNERNWERLYEGLTRAPHTLLPEQLMLKAHYLDGFVERGAALALVTRPQPEVHSADEAAAAGAVSVAQRGRSLPDRAR